MSSAAVQSNPQITQLSDRLIELKGEAEALLSTLDRTSGELSSELRQHLRKHPYAVLAAAAGIGCVLGGGLPSPLARLMVLLGSRVAYAANPATSCLTFSRVVSSVSFPSTKSVWPRLT